MSLSSWLSQDVAYGILNVVLHLANTSSISETQGTSTISLAPVG